MKVLRVSFSDFWPDFNPIENYILSKLKKVSRLQILLSDEPEILFYSVFGKKHKNYDCLKVFFTGENQRPNYKYSDFSISFDMDSYGGKNLRWPLYLLYGELESLLAVKEPEKLLAEKKKFCNFIYGNKKARLRNRFFKKLSRYKSVDSGGIAYNNLGYRVGDKLAFLREYKFTIAFENASFPGYGTEKIFQAMQANSMPIYWGNPRVCYDFNPKSFINAHRYENLDAVVEEVIALDQDQDRYLEKLAQPYFVDNKIPKHLQEEELLNFLDKIVRSI